MRITDLFSILFYFLSYLWLFVFLVLLFILVDVWVLIEVDKTQKVVKTVHYDHVS